MKDKVWLVVILSIVLSVFVVAGTACAQGVKTLKVGTVLPLNFGMGVDTKKALEMQIGQFNDAGGITIKGQNYKVQLIVYDDKWTAEAGRAALERLVYQDKVQYLISIISSPTMVSGLNMVEENKILNLFSGTSLRAMNPKLRYTFGTSTTRTSLMPLWSMVKKVFPNAKTTVFISPNDEGGKARAAEEKHVAEANGVKVLDTLFHPRDAVDFTALAVKAKSLNPDIMDYPGADSGTQFGLELKAVYAAGFRGNAHLSAIAPKLDEVMQVASVEALEGLLCQIKPTELPNPPPMAKKFKEDFTKAYGKWSEAAFPWIPAWPALLEAFKKADSADPTAVADYIAAKGLFWDRVDGPARMVRRPDLGNTKYCDSVAEAMYGQIKNEKIVYIATLSRDEVVAACEKVFGPGWK
ncbi:MAG: ABC transporter substrate-binding protein [Syntrophorhabdales bacterium]|jgi:ABC-type branched-subunit amino acid transport system substrate-binding protein